MSGIKTVLDSIKITKQRGNPIYVLPEGTTIYNGSKTGAGFEDRSTFFAFKKEVADKYGNVTSYKTNRPLNLVALMELTLEDPLYINASHVMKKKLEGRFSVGKDKKERNTDNKQDHEIVDYVCTQDYDGYAMSGNYKGDIHVGDYFDPEMALCHPTDANIEVHTIFERVPQGPPRIERKSKKPRKLEYNEPSQEPLPPPPPSVESNISNVTPPSTPQPATPQALSTPPTTPQPTIPQVLSTPSPQKRKGLFGNNNNNNLYGGKRKTKKRKSKKSKKKTRKCRRK